MINRVVLVGRLTKDAELRYTPSGVAVATFTLAVNKAFKKDEADFIQCVAWKKQAENVANFVHKGSLVGIDGRIQTRSYDGKNNKVYVTEVVAESVQFLEPKREQSAPKTATQQNNSDPFDGTPVDFDDSSLPF